MLVDQLAKTVTKLSQSLNFMPYQNIPKDQDSSPASWAIVVAVLLGLLIALCSSCTVHPSARMPDGSLFTLGGSFASKSTTEWATITTPDGTTFQYSSTGKDDTILAQKMVRAGLLKAAIPAVSGVVDSVGKAVKP